ncbi:MAG: hypothetical protein QOF21_106 [Actinomycetota bacterium]
MPRLTRSFAALLATGAFVVTLSTVWAIASPMGVTCAMASDGVVTAASANTEAGFVASINDVRQSQGLNALIVDATLTSIAQNWSAEMATAGVISHRPDLRAGVGSGVAAMGENVGEGGSVSDLMAAFIASPHHYANLVDQRFTHVGVGSAVSASGVLFTTHEFSSSRVSAAPVVTAPPVTEPPAPRVTVPRPPKPPTTTTQPVPTTVAPTTIPPTTSTTLDPTPKDPASPVRRPNDSGAGVARAATEGCASMWS